MQALDKIPQGIQNTVALSGSSTTIISFFAAWSPVITGLVGALTVAWLGMQMVYAYRKDKRDREEHDKLK